MIANKLISIFPFLSANSAYGHDTNHSISLSDGPWELSFVMEFNDLVTSKRRIWSYQSYSYEYFFCKSCTESEDTFFLLNKHRELLFSVQRCVLSRKKTLIVRDLRTKEVFELSKARKHLFRRAFCVNVSKLSQESEQNSLSNNLSGTAQSFQLVTNIIHSARAYRKAQTKIGQTGQHMAFMRLEHAPIGGGLLSTVVTVCNGGDPASALLYSLCRDELYTMPWRIS